MNDGVALLLERMKTHPEEFIAPRNTGESKWGYLIESYKSSLDVEDQQAIEEGYKKIHQQQFTEKVLEELVDPKFDTNPHISPYLKNIASAGQTLGQSIPSMTLEASEHLRAHLDALQQEYADVFNKPKKEHKTIFGKLFNYS